MNTHYTYFILLTASLAGPLLLSFDRKVSFYKKWRYVFPAMIIPALLYIAWDIYFTSKGVWQFNENYITGITIFNLPVEEVLFFFVVPYSCLFIYECVTCYFPRLHNNKAGDRIFKLLAILLLFSGVIFYNRYYTGWTFVFTALFIAVIYLLPQYFKTFDTTIFLAAYGIILIPFLIVNGILTALPVVLYNDAENLGIRIYTIPFEDIFYGMLLIGLNVMVYEKLKNRQHRI